MASTNPMDQDNVESMMSFLDHILVELNVGLLIYHLEEMDDPRALRLVYANRTASEYTDADLTPLVGKRIHEAFPGLAPHLPSAYAEVVQTGRPRNLGVSEYGGDGRVAAGFYSVKAFPMPKACVGVVFENITARKKLEELIMKQGEKQV